jgi:hypothetical protein
MTDDKRQVILIKNFNKYVDTLSTFLMELTPNSLLKIYKSELERLIKNDSKVMIDTFCLNILKYEDEIMGGDEGFFLNLDYDSDDKDMISKVFEFKKIWHKLSEDNKTSIKQYMQLLCRIGRSYFEIIIENK